MQPFSSFSAQDKARIKHVLFDIDDTITTEGKLTAAAYQALWNLHESGYYVIPVTGRPAGWCDAIIRQWPVDAIIGENGAMVFYSEGSKVLRFEHPSVAGGDFRRKLDAIRDEVLRRVPDSRVAKDQFCRIYDLAIDFNEEPPHLGLDVANEICRICTDMGAVAKVSSIHVNTWFGDYDKLSMALLFFKDVLGVDDPRGSVLYFGDSPNDEPMFAHFPYSCGVANIKPFVGSMDGLPTYVTDAESGEGFAEAIAMLLG